MNLGDHVGDMPEHVLANRAMLQKAVGAQAVFLKQVHGVGVGSLSSSTPDGTEADACLTTQRGLACTIMVADCLPVLLTNTDGTAVAAAHAGWRGLAGTDSMGVLEAVVNAFQALNKPLDPSKPGQEAPETIAWLGPCIGPTAFEVGAEVKAAFEAGQADAARFFEATGNGKFLADLAGLAGARLKALGIARIDGNDSTADWCTVANPSKFFSHRRDAGVTGRMAACIWLT
jgi:YfiH family protein